MLIQKTIQIDAPREKVWQVFTDPALSRRMGGEYVTDWKKGSTFGWKGTDGKMHTQGTILDIDKGKMLKHNLFDPAERSERSVITYLFGELEGKTILEASEEIRYRMNDQEYDEAEKGWDSALQEVKKIAEDS